MNDIKIQLIELIEKYAGDELDMKDILEMNSESVTELIIRLESILEYYYSN